MTFARYVLRRVRIFWVWISAIWPPGEGNTNCRKMFSQFCRWAEIKTHNRKDATEYCSQISKDWPCETDSLLPFISFPLRLRAKLPIVSLGSNIHIEKMHASKSFQWWVLIANLGSMSQAVKFHLIHWLARSTSSRIWLIDFKRPKWQ